MARSMVDSYFENCGFYNVEIGLNLEWCVGQRRFCFIYLSGGTRGTTGKKERRNNYIQEN